MLLERRLSKQEQALLRRILALPQSQRMEILAPLLGRRGSVALVLADRAELSQDNYIAILKRGIAEADASSVKFWLEATVCHLGWPTVFSVLRDVAAPWPSPGASALYHVPFLFFEVCPLSPSLKQEFIQLLELYNRKRPLPYLSAGWRQRLEPERDRKFVFVWRQPAQNSDRRTSWSTTCDGQPCGISIRTASVKSLG
jgi:hypothetical protein